MQGEQGERSNGWDAARDGRSNGWPLGLQRLTTTSSHFLISTPSLTSFSSSDFDTESTRSFFPEKSTTLGSLIGIQSSSQSVQSHDLIDDDEKSTSKGISRTRLWCPLLGCGGGLQEEPLKVSPSLAHLLNRERRDSQRQATSNTVGEHNQQAAAEQEEPDIDETMSYSDTLYGNSCTVSSDPSRPSLRLLLQQPSPTSAYPSAHRNVCSATTHHEHCRETSQDQSRAFWPNFCGKLSTSLAS